ncbi:MAG: tandem-95 repeat protein, partial [Chloroflexi bacterium]|nr:tandem-95 repeat protein [Chloroflexota bacterium]
GATLNAGGTFRWPTTEADGPGVYSATIHLSDGSLTVSHTVLMTVTEQNQAPVLAAIADQNVAEGATINFTAVATDSDVPIQTLNYSLSNAPAGAILDGDGAFSWPTTESDDGIYTTTLNVSDGLLTTSQTINLVVTEVNQPPVLAALGNQTVNEGQLVTFTATATDADLSAQLLTYSLTEAPGGAFINGTSGSFTWQTDDADGGGVYTVAILVSDGAFTDSVTFSITVNEVNIAPTFMAPLSAWTVDEGATVSLNATADDPDIPVQTLSYNLSNAPVGMTISDTGRILWYTGEADGPSLHNVTIDAGDGVVTTSQTVAITVTEINQPPQMPVLSDVTVDEGTYISFSAAATDADLPIQALTYTLETYAPAALDSSGVFSWTTTEADGGDVYPIIIYVSDGVITVSQSIAITVTEVNDAPLLAHIDNVTASERSRVSFTAVATDADVPLQQLTYSLGNAPVSATIGSYSGDFAWMTSRGDGPGVYSATVRVSDGLLTTTQAIAISVTDQNDAPVITPSPAQYVIQTLEITLTVEAVDDPDQFLVFSLADAPSGASINHEGNFSWPTTRDDALGVYTMMVLASDYMLTGTQMLTITIIPGNVAPQANPDNYSTLFETPLHVSAEGGVLSNDTDADGGTLYAVLDTTPPSGTLTLFADGALVYTPTAGFVGEDHFVYHASDGISDSVPTTVTVYVVEDIPVITNLALTAAPNELFANGLDEATLTFTATDEFGNGNLFAGYVVTFDWTSGYYPGSVATTLDANGVATTTFTAGNHAGTAAITATVRDGEGEKQANTQIALFANALAGRLTAEFVQNITYTLVVSNADEINIQESMVISGSVPADTELLSVGNGISVITGGDYGWGYVKASGFDLAPGEAYTLTWTVRPLLLVGDIETQGHATSKTARLRLALSNRVSRLLLPLVYRQYP